VLTIVSLWVFLFPAAWVLSSHTGLAAEGIWWAYPFSNTAGAALALTWFLRGRWQRSPQTGEAWLEEEVAREAIVEEGLAS
jgi:Na+-driven multidrug efflux pump